MDAPSNPPKPISKTSPLSKKHEAETLKFLEEAKALKEEGRKAYYEAENEKLSLEHQAYHQEYGLNTDDRNRTYTLVGEIDDDTIDELVDKMTTWSRMSDKLITVRLNSPGGDVIAGLALYDQLKAIDTYKAPITTVALGMTASMAGIIFQAGRKRIISQNATFLIHEVSVDLSPGISRSQLDDVQDSVKRMNRRLYSILAERSTMSVEDIDKKAERKDWEITAEEAVTLGFADEVGYA